MVKEAIFLMSLLKQQQQVVVEVAIPPPSLPFFFQGNWFHCHIFFD